MAGDIPGIATPPLPNTGCGADIFVRCSNCVGSCASCCGVCLFIRGPVALEPMNAASDIGSPAALGSGVDGTSGDGAGGNSAAPGAGLRWPINRLIVASWLRFRSSGVSATSGVAGLGDPARTVSKLLASTDLRCWSACSVLFVSFWMPEFLLRVSSSRSPHLRRPGAEGP